MTIPDNVYDSCFTVWNQFPDCYRLYSGLSRWIYGLERGTKRSIRQFLFLDHCSATFYDLQLRRHILTIWDWLDDKYGESYLLGVEDELY